MRRKHRIEGTGQIAKERLKLMEETGPFERSPALMERMKREISDIVSRYCEIEPENYEIKVILKQDRKRA
ncbi:MAG: cell division topological specificity factor MinE [Lachnospiraceae bacterium]|nr:cell division topological specificity factor MinE [Lachnospiraceae bacterium]